MAATHNARTHRRHKIARALLWILIPLFALALRALPIAAGWPYIRYVDEGHVVHDAIHMLQQRTLDTGLYIYPALPSELIAIGIKAYAPIYTHKHHRNFWQELQQEKGVARDMDRYYDYVAPPQVLLVARRVVLIFSVGIVVLAGVLARFIGGARAGLLAVLLTALCPALVSRGSIVIVDTIAAFFATAALCFAQRLHAHLVAERGSAWRFALAAGITSGLAFVSKYTAGAVFVAVLVTILLTRASAKTKTLSLVLSVVGLAGASALCMPALVTHPADVWKTIMGIARYYDVISYGTNYWRDALSSHELGVPLVVVGLIGLALLVQRSRATRVAALSWLGFALLLVLVLGRSSFQPFRNLLPLVPEFCVAAAFLLARGDLWFEKLSARRIVNDWVEPATALLVLLSLAVPAWSDVERQRSVIDSRVTTVDWLRDHTAPTSRILALQELAIHPAEWRRIGRKPTVLSWFDARDSVAAASFDYLLSSDFNLQFAPDKNAWSAYLESWTNAVSPLPIAAEFGVVPCPIDAGVWRTNAERIRILKAPNEQ